MLTLTRMRGEIFYVGEDVTVIILGVDGKQVRLGIDAPKEVSVDRKEIREEKRRLAAEAARGRVG